MSEGIGGSAMGGTSGAPGNGIGSSSYGGGRTGTVGSVETGRSSTGAIFEAETAPRPVSQKSNISTVDSGPKPANKLLDVVQSDGIDKGFESLAEGKLSQQPKSDQEKPFQTDINKEEQPSSVKKDQNDEPEKKEKSDEPNMPKEPAKEDMKPRETIADIVRKIAELHEENMRLDQQQADMQQKLMKEKVDSTAEAKVVHFDIARVTYERMRNEQSIQILMVDLTERTSIAA